MKTIIFIFCFVFIIPHCLRAQKTYSVKGFVVDTIDKSLLVNATVVILNSKDSTLCNFKRANDNGSFIIDSLQKGSYILIVSYRGYADYIETFRLDSVINMHDFGIINMDLKSKILKDVIIKGTAVAIKIRGDTTEFNAAAYKIQPNSSVEDLLKQLPGIQIDKDGNISAQGQRVSKVLVDGEEFFGDDPTLVTRNIRGDMVNKVQLYDKKSDQATFTGIDDGKKTKTINIELKEDKKNGYFGKAYTSAGTARYYENQLLFNMFKGKKKLSVYGTLGNDGKTGLGWEDNQGGPENGQANDVSGIYIFRGGDEDLDSFSGYYNGQGIPFLKSAGIHYDERWNKSNESINTNYTIGSLEIPSSSNTISQNNLSSGPLYSTYHQTSNRFSVRNKLDLTYKLYIDTSSNLTMTVDGASKQRETQIKSAGDTHNSNNVLLNNNFRNLFNAVENKILNASTVYTKKFNKRGRTLSLGVSEAYNYSQANGTLYSNSIFFNTNAVVDSSRLVDQYKTNTIKSSILTSNITYTEPLSKKLILLLNYEIIFNNGRADRKSFNNSASGVYNILDSTFSNDFQIKQLFNQGLVLFNFKNGKTLITFGTKLSQDNFRQINQYKRNYVFTRNFTDWKPQATYSYRFSDQSAFRFNYYGNTKEPTVDQLQPVIVNNDPLNLMIGNTRLTSSFSHNFAISYNSYTILTQKYLVLSSNFSFSSNPIVTSTTTDITSGRTITQFVNFNGITSKSFNLRGFYNNQLTGPSINIGLEINADGSQGYNLSNDILNASHSFTYSGQVSVDKYVENKYDFHLTFGPNYTLSGSSLNKSLNNNGFGFNGVGVFNVYFSKKFQLGSDINYQYNSPTQTFNYEFSRVIVNAYISQSFLKAQNILLSLNANDLLNQNVGFNRSISGNFISQNNYNSIKRYFILSLVWKFAKMSGDDSKK